MKKQRLLCASLMMLAFGANAQNLLLNPGFELHPAAGFGNNIGADISPWVIGVGNQPNVVRVDGPGGFAYGNSGPESDASNNGAGAGVGVAQQYLDVAAGANDFYQTFTVSSCPGGAIQKRRIDFSGWFSSRDNNTGTGTIAIRSGIGVAGTVLAQQSITVPNPVPLGGSGLAGWVQVTGVVNVDSGSQVSFVVSMDNDVNFDEASFSIAGANCITATDDTSGPINGATGGPAGNAYTNDVFNGVSPVSPPGVIGSVLTPATPASPGALVPTLDTTTGAVTVPAGTPAGTYTIRYQICEAANPTNCSQANVSISVTGSAALASVPADARWAIVLAGLGILAFTFRSRNRRWQ